MEPERSESRQAYRILLQGIGGFAVILLLSLWRYPPSIEHNLTQEAVRALESVGLTTIEVNAHGRVLTLIGSVEHAADRMRAADLILAQPGVTYVINRLRTDGEDP